jgi:diaminopimelate epimerase
MRIRFTKMQGAGNDFVVLDETRARLGLRTQQYRWLADRHFGIGADQILSVRPSPGHGIDFEYAIHNADGSEVEHCGNGARCFARFVRERGLTDKDLIRVKTLSQVLELRVRPDGRVTVDMGQPVFQHARIPFDPQGGAPEAAGYWEQWPLRVGGRVVPVAVLSMGNPHAVLLVDDVDTAPVATLGPQLEVHPAFPRKVNVGFLQVQRRDAIRLRVWERGAGETLACGTGACAAVVAGIRFGELDARVDVQARGGLLSIQWEGEGHPVRMTGPAVTVFQGEVDIPD